MNDKTEKTTEKKPPISENLKVWKSFFKENPEFNREKNIEKKFENYSVEARRAHGKHSLDLVNNNKISDRTNYESSLTLNVNDKYAVLKEEANKNQQKASRPDYKEKMNQLYIEKKALDNRKGGSLNKAAIIGQEIKHSAISQFFKEIRENNKPREEVNKDLMKHIGTKEIKAVVKSLNQAVKSLDKKSPELQR